MREIIDKSKSPSPNIPTPSASAIKLPSDITAELLVDDISSQSAA